MISRQDATISFDQLVKSAGGHEKSPPIRRAAQRVARGALLLGRYPLPRVGISASRGAINAIDQKAKPMQVPRGQCINFV
jgi:hypothetical protein